MQTLLGSIRSLQLTVHILIFNVHLAPHLERLYGGLEAVVMFDFLEVAEKLTDNEYRIFKYSPTPAFSDGFESVGYDGTQTFGNLGTIKFLVFYYVVIGALIRFALLLIPRIKNGPL